MSRSDTRRPAHSGGPLYGPWTLTPTQGPPPLLRPLRAVGSGGLRLPTPSGELALLQQLGRFAAGGAGTLGWRGPMENQLLVQRGPTRPPSRACSCEKANPTFRRHTPKPAGP